MKRIFSINVTGRNGYSFAVKCETNNGETAIDMALDAGLFEDDADADYAVAENITNYPDDVEHFKDCTYEI